MPDNRGIILLVEDDSSFKQAITRLLRAAGFTVRAFACAEDALADPAVLISDCFLFDIHLPGISGLDLYARLRTVLPETQVVFMTAHEDADSRLRAEQLCASAYLRKPTEGAALIAAIERAINTAPSID